MAEKHFTDDSKKEQEERLQQMAEVYAWILSYGEKDGKDGGVDINNLRNLYKTFTLTMLKE